MFVKLYSRITESSLMEENIVTRYVFVMLLAVSDPEGYVIGTDIALARRLNMPLAEFKDALVPLMAPDPDSNSQEHDGRRIVRSDGDRGYRIVNFVSYRNNKDPEERREYMREYMRSRRSKLVNIQGDIPTTNTSVNSCKQELTTLSNVIHADADADADENAKESTSMVRKAHKFTKPTVEEVKFQCAKLGLPESEAERFWHFYESNGWRVGRNPMRCWCSALVNWRKNYEQRAYIVGSGKGNSQVVRPIAGSVPNNGF